MRRVLRPGGKLIIGDPYVPGFARPFLNILIKFSEKGDYHFYGLDEMQELFLKNDFINFHLSKFASTLLFPC
jgi:SAM-dependent methyltransferase